MRYVSTHQHRLLIDVEGRGPQRDSTINFNDPRGFVPDTGCVHELLTSSPKKLSLHVASWFARQVVQTNALVWCAPHLYPPALLAIGFAARQVYLMRTRCHRDEIWALAECLNSRGVGAVIAAPSQLSRVEARRLQLAAEQGHSVGILLRSSDQSSVHYAAATRWLVEPARGEPHLQRWTIQRLHGHGRHQRLLLEVNRETHHVRASEIMADGSSEATMRRSWA